MTPETLKILTKKFKKSEEYYLTKDFSIKSKNGPSLGFSAGTPLQYVTYNDSRFVFTVRNAFLTIFLDPSNVDEYISNFDEEAIRRAK